MITVRVGASEADGRQGLAILFAVYVGEGYSPAERAEQVYRRDVLEKEDEFLVAWDGPYGLRREDPVAPLSASIPLATVPPGCYSVMMTFKGGSRAVRPVLITR